MTNDQYDFIVAPRSRAVIRKAALGFRDLLEIKEYKFCPVVELLEFVMPYYDNNFSFEVCSISEMGDKEGSAIPDLHILQLREDVYFDLHKDDGRARFTTCHELGHYFLHDNVELSMNRIAKRADIKPYRSAEWQADNFAAEFLMPLEVIDGMSINEIVKTCGVSRKAAELRIKVLSSISK